MKKIPSRYYHFTFVYHEWQSYDVWFLRYGVQQAKYFLILEHSLSFQWKIKILKKKSLEILSPYTCVPQMTIIWCIWFLRYKVQWTEFSVDCFFSFWPPPSPRLKNLENQNFDKKKKKKKKKKKSWRYYHLYHKYINENHMMFGSWDRGCDRLNFFSL